MYKQMLKNRPISHWALIMLVALGSTGLGCQQGGLGMTERELEAIDYKTTAPIGTTSGTLQGPGNDQVSPITRISLWQDTKHIYGIKVFYGPHPYMFGNTLGTEVSLDLSLTNELIGRVDYYEDHAGSLRGLRFTTTKGTSLVGGYLPSFKTAFYGPTHELTDITISSGVNEANMPVIWGIKFNYTIPVPFEYPGRNKEARAKRRAAQLAALQSAR